MVIENDAEQLGRNYRGGDDIAKKLTLRYCQSDQVTRKNKKSLMFKSQFLVKVKNLQNNGEKLQLCNWIDQWLDDNIDIFTQNSKWDQIVMNAAVERKIAGSSIQLKYNEYKKKEALKEIIYKHAERRVDDHRSRRRLKKYENYKRQFVSKHMDFNIKNEFFERQIEKNLGITKPNSLSKNVLAAIRASIGLQKKEQREHRESLIKKSRDQGLELQLVAGNHFQQIQEIEGQSSDSGDFIQSQFLEDTVDKGQKPTKHYLRN